MPSNTDLPTRETIAAPGAGATVGVTHDSRQVAPGMLFVLLPSADGERYARDALARGASCVIAEAPGPSGIDAAKWLRVADAAKVYSQLSASFYPGQPETVVAVTGTDGKTSTAEFARQLWAKEGLRSASLGTLGLTGNDDGAAFPTGNTTPYAGELHRTLQRLAAAGCTHLAMEASSHGLDQHRMDFVRLRAAAFTNFTRDHLDYHASEEDYFAAKARLFSELLPPGAAAILNADDPRFGQLENICAARGLALVSYGRNGKDLTLVESVPAPEGQRLTLSLFGKRVETTLPLIGGFQAMNMLAALGLVVAAGEKIERAAEQIASLGGVPGRLQQVAALGRGTAVYIDYAHTPAALGNVLKTLRPHVAGRLHVVFGCGGDRDPGKRAKMGEAACLHADYVIVTDDNPRGEDAAAIRAAVMKGCKAAREIGDRREAIHAAVRALEKGDLLLIAGKGHEKTQTIGREAIPFDDAEIAREAAALQAGTGREGAGA